MANKLREEQINKASKIFKMLNKQGDGILQPDEFGIFAKKVWPDWNNKTQDELLEMVHCANKGPEKTVDLPHFLRFIVNVQIIKLPQGLENMSTDECLHRATQSSKFDCSSCQIF